MAHVDEHLGHDEQRLAELGYRQELTRAWSSFTNFAISFTIIPVLAGRFTNFSFAWTAGGRVVIPVGQQVLRRDSMPVPAAWAEGAPTNRATAAAIRGRATRAGN